MSKLIKRSIIIVCICCTCSFAPSCASSSYHEGEGTEWIQEQLKQGYITQEEAELLLQQEREEQ